MTILSSDIKCYRPVLVSDGDDNGGRMGTTEVVDGVRNNLFPNVSQAQRAAGLTRYRKCFVQLENSDELALQNACVHLASTTPCDGRLSCFLGTQTDTQADIDSPREYAAAPLASDVSAGATSFQLTLEDVALAACFQTGDSVFIGDADAGEAFDNVTISVLGATVTVTLDGADALASDYLAAETWGASILPAAGDAIRASVDGWVESSSTGTFDESTHPVELGNQGCIEDDWLLTFTSSSAFTVEGAYTGALASGTVSGDLSPANPRGGHYFTLRAAGWGGVWQTGDTLAFSTHPASMPVWFKLVVPAGAAAASTTGFDWVISGESE